MCSIMYSMSVCHAKDNMYIHMGSTVYIAYACMLSSAYTLHMIVCAYVYLILNYIILRTYRHHPHYVVYMLYIVYYSTVLTYTLIFIIYMIYMIYSILCTLIVP